MSDRYYQGLVVDRDEYETRVEPDREPTMLEEALRASDNMLMDTAELVGELSRRLQPVLNEKKADGTTEADKTTAGLFSPLTNNIMSQGDSLSAINSRLRRLLKTLEV